MAKRTKHEKTEYEKARTRYRKCSDRHVMPLETDMKQEGMAQVFHYADLLRKAGNDLTGIMKDRYEQLIRTKRYRKLQKLYGKYSSEEHKKERKAIADQMVEMRTQYGVTWDACRTLMQDIRLKYGIDAVFALAKADKAFERYLTAKHDAASTALQ